MRRTFVVRVVVSGNVSDSPSLFPPLLERGCEVFTLYKAFSDDKPAALAILDAQRLSSNNRVFIIVFIATFWLWVTAIHIRGGVPRQASK